MVTAAAGGVGHLLVQMIKRAGGWVVATVSTEAKAELARSAGADEVILYTQTSFDDKVREFTGGAGVHVVYDSVGKTTFEQSLNSLRPPRLPRTLRPSQRRCAAPRPADPQPKRLALPHASPAWAPTSPPAPSCWRAARMSSAGSWRATLEVRIDKQFPLAQAADAHRYMEGRQTKGKVLLIP